MSTFRFDPPLSLENDINVETLHDALSFAQSYATPRLPKMREALLFWLERASESDQPENAASMFRSWASLENVIVK